MAIVTSILERNSLGLVLGENNSLVGTVVEVPKILKLAIRPESRRVTIKNILLDEGVNSFPLSYQK